VKNLNLYLQKRNTNVTYVGYFVRIVWKQKMTTADEDDISDVQPFVQQKLPNRWMTDGRLLLKYQRDSAELQAVQ
jgi:hypothetical protein